jgi:hypothetical protein
VALPAGNRSLHLSDKAGIDPVLGRQNRYRGHPSEGPEHSGDYAELAETQLGRNTTRSLSHDQAKAAKI